MKKRKDLAEWFFDFAIPVAVASFVLAFLLSRDWSCYHKSEAASEMRQLRENERREADQKVMRFFYSTETGKKLQEVTR